MDRGKSEDEEPNYVGEQVFDDLIKIIEKTNTTVLRSTYTYNKELDASIIKRNFFDEIHNFTKNDAIEIEEATFSKGVADIRLKLIEPTCSYLWYGYALIPNNDNQSKALQENFRQQPIDIDHIYQCRLIRDGRFVYLDWNSGRHWLYDFGNKSTSSIRRLFDILLKNPDRLYEAKELRELGVSFTSKGLKEVFTKKFMRGKLYSRFIFSESPSTIALRANISISGKEIVQIIRENLHFIYAESRRHKDRKLGLQKSGKK